MVMGSITCEPKQLANALAAVKPAVDKSSVQALTGVRIRTENGQTTLMACDFDLFIRRELPAIPSGDDFDVLVSHAELVKVAKAFASAENVVLTFHPEDIANGRRSEVSCFGGHRTITLKTLRLQDHPDFPNLGGNTILEDVNGSYLSHAIEQVAKFVSRDQTRPVLTGVYLDRDEKNGELTFVATDSYRLCTRTLRGVSAWAGGYNIPATGLVAAAKLMRKEENVTLRAHNSHAILVWPGTEIAIRVIDGQYPNYRQLMPADSWPNEVTMPLSELRAGADLGTQFLTGNAPIRFYVNGVVKLHGQNVDGPSFEEILPGAKTSVDKHAVEANTGSVALPQNGEGFDFEIGWNAWFLRDIAHSLEGELAFVKLISPLRPALIHSEDDSERHLLMPIRLNV